MKIPSWIFLIAGMALIAGSWLHGNWHGSKTTAATYKAQLAENNVLALEHRNVLQGIIDDLTKKYLIDITAIESERDAALERLRNRPVRTIEAASPNCSGATGAQLSREDAEFLTREAARGDEYAIALQACYKYADEIQQ